MVTIGRAFIMADLSQDENSSGTGATMGLKIKQAELSTLSGSEIVGCFDTH